MAEALGLWMQGRIRSHEFDERLETALEICERSPADDDLFQIFACLWGTYDDFKDHYIHVGPWAWARMKRCLAFLKSELPYKEARPLVRHTWIPFLKVRGEPPPFWPFWSQAEWRAHAPLLHGLGLPASEPYHAEALRTYRLRASS